MVTIDKGRPFEKILRKVAAQAKFRENGKVGPSLPGFLRQTQDASRISLEIAYSGIELRKRYLHAGTLEYGCQREIANTSAMACVRFIATASYPFFCGFWAIKLAIPCPAFNSR
jgi:hypothetical protein